MKNTTQHNDKCKTTFFSKNSLPSSLYDRYQITNVPTDGSCLFWAIVLAYLVEIRADNQFLDSESYQLKFTLACKYLFGEIEQASVNSIRKIIDQLYSKGDTTYKFNSILRNLVTSVFRNRVVDFIAQHEDEFKGFITTKFNTYLASMRMPNKYGGEPEIRAIVKLLNCNITVFDLQRQSTVSHLVDSNILHGFSKIETSPPLIQLRTLYLFYKADKKHYYFGITNKNFLSDNENLETPSFSQEVSFSDSVDRNMDKPLYSKNRPEVGKLTFKVEKNIYLPSILNGIALGVFLEALLWLLPASPLARVFFRRESMDRFDRLLMSFLDRKKPFIMGIILGAMGSLMKALFKNENRIQIFLMLAIVFSIMPVSNLFDKKIPQAQMLVLCILMLFLAPRGFINIINFSLPYISKTTDAATLLTGKITKRFPFFSHQETENVQQKGFKETVISAPIRI